MFLISFRSEVSERSPADAEFFSQSDTVISSGVPSAAAFTYTVSSLEILLSAAITGVTAITAAIPAAREAATAFFLFLFILYDSFSAIGLHKNIIDFNSICFIFCPVKILWKYGQ